MHVYANQQSALGVGIKGSKPGSLLEIHTISMSYIVNNDGFKKLQKKRRERERASSHGDIILNFFKF